MIKKIKIKGNFFIYDDEGVAISIINQEVLSWWTKQGDSVQVVALHDKGVFFLPRFHRSEISVDFEFIEDIKNEDNKQESGPLMGLRAFIGQDIKTFTVELK